VSTESLNRTSNVVENPSQRIETPRRVNVDVLKQKLLEESKKEKKKRMIILYTFLASLGVLTILTY
jgi:autonomous glycyl radical cofactor GrcA|tara:strand:- start:426 stop:623 length:198 start_codon:yes stop_codon:yes gene_type:complete